MGGLLFGSLIGASAGLLLAPYSGESLRAMLRDRGEALREKALTTADEARHKAEELQVRGKSALAENVDRVTRTAEAVKRTAQETWQQGSAATVPGSSPAADY
jgi:gas vesicle protein